MLKTALPRSVVNDLNTLPRQKNAVVPICPEGCRGAQPVIASVTIAQYTVIPRV